MGGAGIRRGSCGSDNTGDLGDEHRGGIRTKSGRGGIDHREL
jgi:hypothetical protein